MDEIVNFIIGNREPTAWLSRTLHRWRAGAAAGLERGLIFAPGKLDQLYYGLLSEL